MRCASTRTVDYVDATFGRGGHTRALLRRLSPEGRILAIDRDPAAIAVARELANEDARVVVRHGRMSEMGRFADEAHLSDVVGVFWILACRRRNSTTRRAE